MKKKVLIILGSVLIVTIMAVSVFVLLSTGTNEQTAAIKEAKEWRASNGVMMCGQAITPAVHTASGARYTFSDTCLPPGWEENY